MNSNKQQQKENNSIEQLQKDTRHHYITDTLSSQYHYYSHIHRSINRTNPLKGTVRSHASSCQHHYYSHLHSSIYGTCHLTEATVYNLNCQFNITTVLTTMTVSTGQDPRHSDRSHSTQFTLHHINITTLLTTTMASTGQDPQQKPQYIVYTSSHQYHYSSHLHNSIYRTGPPTEATVHSLHFITSISLLFSPPQRHLQDRTPNRSHST